MYKDLGRQGLTYAKPDSPYGALVADFVAKKIRLGVDQWGSTGREYPEVTQPIQDLVAREAPDYDPYPWGRFDWVRTLVLNITLAQPLAQEYAELFRGLGEDELVALADSFAFARVRRPRDPARPARAQLRCARRSCTSPAHRSHSRSSSSSRRAPASCGSASRRPASVTATTTT